ncbi:TIGR01777 family oxidoreductase [Chitinophaga nivalis]|uniref:TIGR01777 family oxidoreductase n=1 Tax=Chitinophaga nivalis TaxID=2991709 RepID=A0ABT3ISY0_9BACT|nr:TIGR01777 family oxidoreductase [Chitinophaga nivalis]MCW3463230.1 TIGR01777 family oxidoreductase [Chitinophaga nivalis]MCW3487080.1 TIGR01777 family oxidoreductase [Chitinophaga nivalis]
MESVIITGGTGLVGTALTRLLLERGFKVIILTRQPEQNNNPAVTYAHWDVNKQTIDVAALQEADYIVHLAGANVAGKRWSNARKQEIRDSRTQSSELLFRSLQQYPNKVKKVISASATGYYGSNKQHPFTETDAPATDYLGTTTVAWEKSIGQVATLDKKLVIFRLGMVLSRDGGALKEFYKPLRFGFASILGSGDQYISWIHIQDLVRLFFNAIVNDKLEGVYNAVAPQPVTNRELILTMARVAKGHSFMTTYVPAFALKLIFGEMSVEVLKSVNVSSAKIQRTGFLFSYPTIGEAMEQLFSS